MRTPEHCLACTQVLTGSNHHEQQRSLHTKIFSIWSFSSYAMLTPREKLVVQIVSVSVHCKYQRR